MEYSFSFCGTAIEDIGLKYAPENANTYIFNPAEASVHEQTFDGHDGGYYYGKTLQPKVFTLRCYYEDENVLGGLMSKLNRMFKIGRSGRLVFSIRPWLYYIATVTDVDTSKLLNADNGLVTITLKAYYPYARSDKDYIDPESDYAEDMRSNSELLEDDINPSTEYENLTAQTEIILYNGGTQKATVKVDIAGNVGTGVTLYNTKTEQMMEFKALNQGNREKYVECNGYDGNCYWVSQDADNGKNAFIYHSQGFIELEPAEPLYRDIAISTQENSTSITSEAEVFTQDMVGRYVYADGMFRAIRAVTQDGSSMSVVPSCEHTQSEVTVIADMNRIIVTPETDMDLTYLAFQYEHTFS